MTYTLRKDSPGPGWYAIIKTESVNTSIVWQGKNPRMSESGINKLVDVLNEANPTGDMAAEYACRMILGRMTEIGDA